MDMEKNGSDKNFTHEVRFVQQLECSYAKELWIRKKIVLIASIIYIQMLNTGLDNVIGGNSLAIPAFRKTFGYYYAPDDSYLVAAVYQSAWSGASVGSQFFGNLISGFVVDRFGHRVSMLIASFISIIATTVMITSREIGQLIASKVIVGLSVGFVVAQASPYAAELSPVRFRGIFTVSVGTSLHIGQWLGTLAVWLCVKAYPNIDDERSFKVLFGLQYIFAVWFILAWYFLPESPRHCIRKGTHADAIKVLKYLYGHGYDHEAHANDIEYEIIESNTNTASLWEPWRGTNRRRLLIGITALCGQLLTGNLFFNQYQSYMYQLANIGHEYAITFGNYSIALLGNFTAFFLIDKVGRRPLYLWCIAFSIGCNSLTGAMQYVLDDHKSIAAGFAITSVAMWKFTYMLGLSPGAYAIMGEVPTSRLRAKTNAWINIFNSLLSFAISYAIPALFNPDEANLGLRMGFIFGGASIVLFVIAFLIMPETKQRSGHQLDLLFQQNVTARRFRKAEFNESDELIPESVGRNADAEEGHGT